MDWSILIRSFVGSRRRKVVKQWLLNRYPYDNERLAQCIEAQLVNEYAIERRVTETIAALTRDMLLAHFVYTSSEGRSLIGRLFHFLGSDPAKEAFLEVNQEYLRRVSFQEPMPGYEIDRIFSELWNSPAQQNSKRHEAQMHQYAFEYYLCLCLNLPYYPFSGAFVPSASADAVLRQFFVSLGLDWDRTTSPSSKEEVSGNSLVIEQAFQRVFQDRTLQEAVLRQYFVNLGLDWDRMTSPSSKEELKVVPLTSDELIRAHWRYLWEKQQIGSIWFRENAEKLGFVVHDHFVPLK
jgi:hypothetical protein